MSRSIVIVGETPTCRDLAARLGAAIGRRVVDGPSRYDDEVALVARDQVERLDLTLTCVLAPGVPATGDVRALLDWAMERGDVLTRWEHEQVMP